jgi:hypothetical protein
VTAPPLSTRVRVGLTAFLPPPWWGRGPDWFNRIPYQGFGSPGMYASRKKKIVLLGMMSRHPVAGVVWQTLHYLVGFERLGYEAYYVEAGAHQPSSLLAGRADGDRSAGAAAFIAGVLRRFDLGDRWAFHALQADGRCYGLDGGRLQELYRSAALIVNLHGGTYPLPEHYATGRLVYLETDPVELQIQLHDNDREAVEFLKPHCAFFTFGENYGSADCGLPVSAEFAFRPTRQPVVLDFWRPGDGDGGAFTTIGNWRQTHRDVRFRGQVYHWSKHHEYLKYLDLPARSGAAFELALSRCEEEDRRLLEGKGWRVRDALAFSTDLDDYREYVRKSRGEFTVAKDQNIRLRSGWFSDRSATYLAAGRPVITQETGFSNVLPTGAGLFAFETMEDVLAAVEQVNGDYVAQSRAAREVAREHFAAERVLGSLLDRVGL